MTLRAGAKPGEIFAPEYQPYFIKIVHDDFKKRSAADRKAIIWELPINMKVDINTEYPTTIPLATFPPALLSKLPDLPPELEYRIVDGWDKGFQYYPNDGVIDNENEAVFDVEDDAGRGSDGGIGGE